ncbi:FkbM family methyltransferase [Candidatus Pelagibacter sp.]|nr:FkbM family methyltransferase [Candidatus Pelagibacter sp.]
MRIVFNLIIKIVDFFYQKKIITFFKNNSDAKYDVLLDVGAHEGETISSFLKNFKIKNTYSFEASKNTYHILETNIDRIKNTYKETNIEIFNFGVGSSVEQKIFYELPDSNSSTFNLIDQKSSYFKRKNKILSFFFKKKFTVKKNYVSQIKLSQFIKNKKLIKIDILKIDTEGYELEVIKGLEEKIKIVNFIYFEHHYDNMIKKNYTFSEIHDFLSLNGFNKVFKVKMPLRKSFDYIYRKKTV